MSPSRNGQIAEVAQQRAVAGEKELHRVVTAERAVVHLSVEVADGAIEERPQ